VGTANEPRFATRNPAGLGVTAATPVPRFVWQAVSAKRRAVRRVITHPFLGRPSLARRREGAAALPSIARIAGQAGRHQQGIAPLDLLFSGQLIIWRRRVAHAEGPLVQRGPVVTLRRQRAQARHRGVLPAARARRGSAGDRWKV